VRAACLVCLCLLASPARAYDFQIEAETIGQAYQLRAADDAVINRRRLTQYLGLHLFNLGPTDSLGRPLPRNQFYITVAMRFDREFADYTQPAELSGRTPQRELFNNRLEILYGYAGGRDLAGFLDFELGRQVMIDLFDYYAFDGLHILARTPFHVAAEAWGGLEVSGATVFDSPVFRVDGTALGQNPLGSPLARQEQAFLPTFGVALRSVGLRDVNARVSYMQTLSLTGDPRAPGEPKRGVIEEKVAVTASGRLFDGRLVPWAAFRYNLLVGELDEAQVGARAQWGRHGASVEYVLAAPTFDGDSIFNVFASERFDDVRAMYDVVLGRVRAYAQLFVRLFGNESTALGSAPPSGLPSALAYGGSTGARVDLGRGYARVDGYYQDGYGGIVAGVDLSGRVRLFGDPVDGLFAEARISYAHFADDLRPLDHADSLGMQGGLRYTVTPGVTLHALVEENVNRLYPSQLRALALLDLGFWLAQKPRGITRPQPWSGW
jgi:hypothetical protein